MKNVGVVRQAVGADLDAASGLLERATELSVLGDCLEAVQESSRGSVVLVSGEAGAGKTALLRRFCEGCAESVRILWGDCDPLFTPRPLGPLLAVAESAGGELEQLMAGEVLPHELAAAVVRELRARAPTVFVLEDVHWADEATLDVLRLLAGKAQAVPALVIASYRDDQLDRTDPLRIMLGELPSPGVPFRRTRDPPARDRSPDRLPAFARSTARRGSQAGSRRRPAGADVSARVCPRSAVRDAPQLPARGRYRLALRHGGNRLGAARVGDSRAAGDPCERLGKSAMQGTGLAPWFRGKRV